jgi:hypothetical protein
MIVEVVFDKQYAPPSQRRLNRHVKQGSTKKGNKKRGLRSKLMNLKDEEGGSDDDDDEDDWPLSGGRPPAMTGLVQLE